MDTYETMQYDEGDFTYTPMFTGNARDYAEHLLTNGASEVRIMTYQRTARKPKLLSTERLYLTGHPDGNGQLLLVSSLT